VVISVGFPPFLRVADMHELGRAQCMEHFHFVYKSACEHDTSPNFQKRTLEFDDVLNESKLKSLKQRTNDL
jgi:hypothetical protein